MRAENKGFVPVLTSLKMNEGPLHGNDSRQVCYDAYVLLPEAAGEDSLFASSYLVRRRATMRDAQWLPPSDYALQTTPQPGAPTTAANLSLEKRAMNLLAGEDVPAVLFDSLLHTSDGAPKPLLTKRSDVVTLLNWTPYEGGPETACLRANLQGPSAWKCCSLTLDTESGKMCEARLARSLLLDWKTGNHQLMPKPQLVFEAELPQHEVEKFRGTEISGLTIMKMNGALPEIPAEVRRKWSSDPVYATEWIAELKKCDELLTSPEALRAGGSSEPVAAVAAAADDVAGGGSLPDDWVPKPKESLRNITHACTSDIENLSLHIVQSEGDGNPTIYLEANEDMTVPTNKPVFKVGASDWFKPPKSTRLLANEAERSLYLFEVRSDLVKVAWFAMYDYFQGVAQASFCFALILWIVGHSHSQIASPGCGGGSWQLQP